MTQRLIRFLTSAFLFLLPIYFLPFKSTAIETDKQFLLVIFSVVLFILTLLSKYQAKTIKIVRTPVDFLLLLLVLLFLASTFLSSPNKIEALTTPLGTGTVVAGVLLFFSLTQTTTRISLTPLIISSTFASLYLIILEIRGGLSPNSFSTLPLGGLLAAALFLLPVIIYLGATSLSSFSQIRQIRRISQISSLLPLLALLLTASAFGLSLFHLLTDQPPLLLPFPFGWAIVMEMYKNFLTFFLGVGPANFPFAYTLGKPIAINNTLFWNITPAFSSNTLLTFATESGVLVALLFILLFLTSLKFSQNPNYPKEGKLPWVLFLLILTIQFFLPTSVALFTLTFILLSMVSPKWETPISFGRVPSYYLIGPISLISLILLFYQSKAYLGEIFLRQAIAAVADQRGGDAFNYLQNAIRINPSSDRYFNFSSGLSLSLAQNLAQSPEATTSSSQQQIVQLTQTAITQARRATELNRLNSQHWGNLGNIYQSMTGTVEGADRFALDSYNQQMMLDPNSPAPKVAAASLLLRLSQLAQLDKLDQATQSAQLADQARTLLIQAINLKPDWNRARYQMAQLFKLTGRVQDAAAELQRALDLTPSDSEDYKRIQQELEQLKRILSPETTPSPAPPAPPRTSPTPTPRTPRSGQ